MIILYLIIGYLLLGMTFSIPFFVRWIHIIDEGARHTSWQFKLIILPGCITLWPILLKRYLQTKAANR